MSTAAADPVAAVLARLEAVRRSGDGWTARCPAHEDRRASLSIGTGRDGRALLTCHAGCSADAVAHAAGLELRDLFPAPPEPFPIRSDHARIVKTYPYTDEFGAVLSEAVRLEPKRFYQRRPDGGGGWINNVRGVRAVPYRLPAVVEAVEAARVVFVVEGEKDADRLAELGLVATCNAAGAGKWTEEHSAPLKGARVVILPDNDGPGRRHAEDVAHKLHGTATEVRVVELPDLPPKGDVSDWLDAGGTVERLKELVRAAPLWEAENAKAEPAHPSLSLRTLQEILSDPDAMKEPEPVVPRLAWAGRVTLLAGREKLGKSTLASAGAAATSSAARFLGEHGTAGPVLWVGLEEHPGDTAARFVTFGAEPRRVYVLDRLEKPFADLAAAVEQTGAVLVVVDTLAAFTETLVDDPGSSAKWTPVMAGLTRIARDSGAAFLLLHHARKSDGAYRDSTAIGAGVDSVLELHPGEEASVRKLKAKGRWTIEDCAVRLDGDRYTLAAGELSMDARVILYVENNPGCSMRQLREGVSGKAAVIDSAAHRLLERGAIEDRGGDSGRRLFVSGRDTVRDTPASGSVSHENAGDTRRDTVAGHGSRPERVPFPNPREVERDTVPETLFADLAAATTNGEPEERE
jgi:hypothetical protein